MFRRGAIVPVTWNHTLKIQRQRHINTRAYLRGSRVKDPRWKAGPSKHAPKEVGAKKQSPLCAIEAQESLRMTGQMHGSQTAPNINHIATLQPALRGEGNKREKRTSHSLEYACDTCQPTVGRTALIVISIQRGSGNPCPGILRDSARVKNVINMAMRKNDPPDRFAIPPPAAQCSKQGTSSADKSRIQQIEPAPIAEDVKGHQRCPNSEKAVL